MHWHWKSGALSSISSTAELHINTLNITIVDGEKTEVITTFGKIQIPINAQIILKATPQIHSH